jgi:hypothetical protein
MESQQVQLPFVHEDDKMMEWLRAHPESTGSQMDMVRALCAQFPDSAFAQKGLSARKSYIHRRFGKLTMGLKPQQTKHGLPKKLDVSDEDLLQTLEAMGAAWLAERCEKGQNVLEWIGRGSLWTRFKEFATVPMSLETFKRRLGDAIQRLPAESHRYTQALMLVEFLGGPWLGSVGRGHWDWWYMPKKSVDPAVDSIATAKSAAPTESADDAPPISSSSSSSSSIFDQEAPKTPGSHLLDDEFQLNADLMDLIADY